MNNSIFSNMGIRKKLLAICVFSSAVTAAVGWIGYWSLGQVAQENLQITDVYTPKLEHSNKMQLGYARVRIALRTLGLPGLTDAQSREAIENTKKAIGQYEEAFQKFKELSDTDGEQKIVEKVEMAWAAFKATGVKVLDLYAKNKSANEKEILFIFLDECPKRAAEFNAAIDELAEFIQNKSHEQIAKSIHTTQRANKSLLFLVLFGLAFSSITGFVFSGRLYKELNNVVQSLSQGSSEVSSEVSQLSHLSAELSASASQ